MSKKGKELSQYLIVMIILNCNLEKFNFSRRELIEKLIGTSFFENEKEVKQVLSSLEYKLLIEEYYKETKGGLKKIITIKDCALELFVRSILKTKA